MDFGDELLMLVGKEFPGLQDEVRKVLALQKQCHPKTIHEAISSTIELLKSNNYVSSGSMTHIM